MTDKTPPYVIDPKDIRKGDLIEIDFGDRDQIVRGIAYELRADRWMTAGQRILVSLHVLDDIAKVTLLDRPEPPKPALPPTPGTVIYCKVDHAVGAALVRAEAGWVGVDAAGDVRRIHDNCRITDWTVVYDPTAPKSDDGLRERVEALAETFGTLAHEWRTDNPARSSAYHMAARLTRDTLTATSADA